MHAVLSENTAVYHFWGIEAHRWLVASVELFDASPTTLRWGRWEWQDQALNERPARALRRPPSAYWGGALRCRAAGLVPRAWLHISHSPGKQSRRRGSCPFPSPRVADLAFSETNTTASSWDAAPIEAGSQTFLARPAVVGLAATRSSRGNTAKQVMLLTTTGAGGASALASGGGVPRPGRRQGQGASARGACSDRCSP